MKSVPPKTASATVPPSTPRSAESAIAVPTIRVLKIATCPSLSGRSTLTYHLGVSPDSDIKLRVFANSGGGFFSREWLSMKEINQIMEKRTAANPVVSSSFGGLFAGKSVNTTGFILAVLKHIGLVKPISGKPRCYEADDPGVFMAELKALIDSSVDLNTDQPVPPIALSKIDVSKGKQKAA